MKAYVNDYFNRFKKKSLSDNLVFERMKNNYKRLIELTEKRNKKLSD